MIRGVALVLAGLLVAPPLAAGRPAAQDPAADSSQPELPLVQNVLIVGASVYTAQDLERRFRLVPGVRLRRPPEEIAKSIEERYREDGYTFARVSVSMTPEGTLRVDIDEGQIDEIEFRGVDADAASKLRDEFGFKAGDVFNKPQADRALDHALGVAQGAIVRGYSPERPATYPEGRELRRDHPFTMIVDNGRHVLQVNLRTRTNRSGVFIGTQGREDWYSPVDGFAPAIGFQSTIFDRHRFNHTYWTAYAGYKFASERSSWSIGFERPFLRDGVLQTGASIQDITASDDQWRITNLEQSLVAFTFRNTFRDYYRRKGFQLHAAVRPWAEHEWLLAWRDESHSPVINEASYALFREDHPFRENAFAQRGDLRAVIAAYTYDSRGLTQESPGERYRRHQLDDLFGSQSEREHGVRVEWRSELAPRSLDHDFDFTRHIVNARTWLQLAPSRLISGRLMAGASSGTLPPQRVFALGGIGSVHGYSFKQEAGARMLLLNGELRQGFGHSGIGGLVFIDGARVYRPLGASTGEWLKGVGIGVELGSSARVEFGWRLDDIPKSLQVLFRLNPSF